VPFIFHWWPKSAGIELKREEFRDDWTILDLNAAYKLLSGLENVDAECIGIVGRCWVGAASNPLYKACAVFYAGRVKLVLGEGNLTAIGLTENMTCPVISFFGNEDENPSPKDVDDYSQALKKAGVEHIFHRYDGAGHAFQRFNSEERCRHRASEDAWEKVLAFFEEELK
jgi:carboxymethylenebutenolidase